VTVPNIAKEVDQIRRRAEAIRLRIEGKPWQEIADLCGHSDKAAAYKDVQRALDERRTQLGLDTDQLLELELAKLDAMEAAAWKVLRTKHLTVSHGRVITITKNDPAGGEAETVELEDDGPVLAAIGTLLRVGERRSKLLGLDSPTKIDAGVTVRYEIAGVDMDALR